MALVDNDLIGQILQPDAWSRAFGVSFAGPTQPSGQGFGYRAYKSVRPDEPSIGVELIYNQLYLLAIGIQGAGPNLNPQSFEKAMFDYPRRTGPSGTWGFAPGDYTTSDDAREVFWNPSATSVQTRSPGTYQDPNGGARYPIGKWPATPPRSAAAMPRRVAIWAVGIAGGVGGRRRAAAQRRTDRHRAGRRHPRFGDRADLGRTDPHLAGQPGDQLRQRRHGRGGRAHGGPPVPVVGLAVLGDPGRRRRSWASGSGALVEILVVRRFATSPRLVLTVATIGLAQVLGGIELLIPERVFGAGGLVLGAYETPLSSVQFKVGPSLINGNHLLTLAVVPVVVLALAWFLRRSLAGTAIRAAAENTDRARLLGVPVRNLTTIVWALAGALAALTFVLKAPFLGAAPPRPRDRRCCCPHSRRRSWPAWSRCPSPSWPPSAWASWRSWSAGTPTRRRSSTWRCWW